MADEEKKTLEVFYFPVTGGRRAAIMAWHLRISEEDTAQKNLVGLVTQVGDLCLI